MDFIERLLGFSPDGGSGLTELSLVLVPVIAVAFLITRRYLRRTSASLNGRD
jgi:hypothetical protein